VGNRKRERLQVWLGLAREIGGELGRLWATSASRLGPGKLYIIYATNPTSIT